MPIRGFISYPNDAYILISKDKTVRIAFNFLQKNSIKLLSLLKLNLCVNDINAVKQQRDSLSYKLDCEDYDLADFIFDKNGNIFFACTKNDNLSSIHIYIVTTL